MRKPLLIGSANRKKAQELAELLEGLPWDVKSLRDFPEVPAPEETGATFEENALLKAHYYTEHFKIACVADDSGLEVDALGGAPGVHSARYAGEAQNDQANMEKLLDALEEYLWHERTARFRCCAVFLDPGAEPFIANGVIEGHISVEPFGKGGFGYDPLFVPEDHDCTFGEMDPADKHEISHRGRAFRQIRAHLETLG